MCVGFKFSFHFSGLLEIPTYGLTTIVLHHFGRRIPYAATLIFTGVALVSTMFLEKDSLWTTGVVLFGKSCTSFAFAEAFLYSSEIYPTVVCINNIVCLFL